MADVNRVTAAGLHWVKSELGGSLERVSGFIESFLEAPANPLPLQRSLVELHQIRGTLRMIQCDGASLLAEEMRDAVQGLLADVDNAPEKAFEALLGATVQLTDYLDVIDSGEPDNALVFLPLINELRVARGAGVVSESRLFARYMPMLVIVDGHDQEPAGQRAPNGGQAAARTRLAAFQAALLRVLKEQEAATSLTRLAEIFAAVEADVSEVRGRQVFTAAAALIEALIDEGVTAELEIKRLLGRVGQQLKAAADGGDAVLSDVSDELLYGLVYFAGRADSNGVRVQALRRDYDLDRVLPDAGTLERLRGRLRGPNTGLVTRLSGAIKEDLASVKDQIDLLIRAGERAPEGLDEAVAVTERVAETLGMLGLDMLRRVVQNQARAIQDLGERGERGHEAWMDVALALLRVEQGLDNALFAHMHHGRIPDEAPDEHVPGQDIETGAASIYREGLVNLSRLKTLIPNFIDDGETALLGEAARLLREIEAGLQIVGRDDAIEMVASLRGFVNSQAMLRAREQPPLVLLLADAIASLEYYLEALQSGLRDVDAPRARAAACVTQLEVPAEQQTPLVDEYEASAEAAEQDPATAEPVDPEIRDVFLEEAEDVLATLRRDVPVWSANVEDSERLGEIRRAFHTLKGSGRMAGAADIGAFGWAVENMLNRCLEGAISAHAEVVTVVADAVEAMPELIEDFRAGRAPRDLAPLIERANRAAGIESSQAGAGEGGQAELWRVFRSDASQRIELLSERAARPAPLAVDDELMRTLHTLKGSAEAVHAGGLSGLAAALEQYADTSRSAGRGLESEALRLLADAAAAMQAAVEDSTGGKHEARLEALREAVERRLEDLPREAVDASADRELLIVFTDEACDLVDAMDKGLTDWIANPHDPHYPRELRAVCHKLKGSARTAEAAAIGEVAQALEHHVAGYLDADGGPDAAEFERLRDVVDGLYDMLDRFRQGDRSSEPSPLLSRLDASPAGDPASTSMAPGSGETGTPVTSDSDDNAACYGRGVSANDPRERSVSPDTATPAPGDDELAAVFLGEADELIEGIDERLERWRAAPEVDAPRQELLRLLHTLKGSARMAGVTTVGDLGHELETAVGRAASMPGDARNALIGSLRPTVDGLHSLLDRVRAGETNPDSGELLARLRGATGSAEALEPAPPSDGPESPTSGFATAFDMPDADAVDAATGEIEPSAPVATEFADRLFWEPPEEATPERGLPDTARVAVEDLDSMLNQAGEISIFRARLAEQNAGLGAQLQEMAQTARRLRDQLRKLDQETEAQIVARHDHGEDRYPGEFDPLEMDRYSALHELSRGLAEGVTDLMSLHGSMSELNERGDTLLTQQGRVNASLQQGLMRTLMVPFSRQVQRLQRLVRQTADEYGRQAEIEFAGTEAELDRNVLERMGAPLEHLLRNAIVHGIETPDDRRAAGKADAGTIAVRLYREGTQLVIEVRDDGRGLDFDAIRETARERGLLDGGVPPEDAELAQFIFEPGFSTARELTQVAGRGVGMDVVNNEIKQLGGNLSVASEPGRGTRFAVRLPLTLAISQALLVRVGDEQYAVPLGSIEGVTRVPRATLEQHVDSEAASFEYGGQSYRLRMLGDLLGAAAPGEDEQAPANRPVLLVRAGQSRTAFAVDGMSGSREIVVKPVGPQVASVPGISGATVMADGDVMLILDMAALMQMRVRRALREAPTAEAMELADHRPTAMVVDDSITIRRVSERFLSRNGFRVTTAKDGMDALAKLQASPPDVVLLDIEMPRIDGFELATYMRNSDALAATPIVMITSRSGDKHRRRAESIGVDRFVTKPYQEQDLLAQIHAVLRREEGAAPVDAAPGDGDHDDG